VLDRRPGWPVEPSEMAARGPGWPFGPEVPAARRPEEGLRAEPAWPTAEPPAWPTATPPTGTPRCPADAPAREAPVLHPLSETTATGLRKFDLGNVPASVTPPRSWRRAAWFAVGTSAAVVLGLTVAAVELMGRPLEDSTLMDALPAYPSGPLTLERLPDHKTSTRTPTTSRRGTPSTPPTAGSGGQSRSAESPMDTVVGGTVDGHPTSEGPSQSTSTPATPADPTRRTVGPPPVVATDPQAMGDRTEEYFRLVTTDPAAAHLLTSGGMAREGTEGIEARYAGVERVEVQEITIDRNDAVTTSTVRVVREDGTVTVEQRQLTFTWGDDPTITDDSITQ
jgi:hypothetical protein